MTLERAARRHALDPEESQRFPRVKPYKKSNLPAAEVDFQDYFGSGSP